MHVWYSVHTSTPHSFGSDELSKGKHKQAATPFPLGMGHGVCTPFRGNRLPGTQPNLDGFISNMAHFEAELNAF